MLGLQCARELLLPFMLFTIQLGLAAHLDLRQGGERVELDAIQHRRK